MRPHSAQRNRSMNSLTSKVALPAVAAKDVAPKGGDRVRDDRAWSAAGQKVVDLVRAAAKVPIVELPNSNGESPS